MLERFRNKINWLLEKLSYKFKDVSPNKLTILSFGFALAILFTYYFSKTNYFFLLISALLIGLSGFFDAIDGFIARLKKRESKRGDFLDHILDRYADFVLIVGLPLTGLCNWILALFAYISVLLASYAGTQAQALGLGRIYKGFLGRADRIVILFFALILQSFFIHFKFLNLTILEIAALIFIIFGNLTAFQRIFLSWKYLQR
ncbi:MAG: CDP-alcohol phosphatidyltransferase family protein [Candidatus Nanoarchaeia archaeon]